MFAEDYGKLRIPTRLISWGALAVTPLLLLFLVLGFKQEHIRQRWAVLLSHDSIKGEKVFREKGCSECHLEGGGHRVGKPRELQSSLPELVAAMWNHAPRMWEKMRAEGKYPSLTYEETAAVVSFLYMSRHEDEPGNPQRGKVLFESKNCQRCHSIAGVGGNVGPDLAKVGAKEGPMAWVQAMWNHASAMQNRMAEMGIEWPNFKENEMADLLAYVREANGGPGNWQQSQGDPGSGWQVFQQKSCLRCHSVKTEGEQRSATNLGPHHRLPGTFTAAAAVLWNYFPQMRGAMENKGVSPPQFERREMADVVSFLYSLRYYEPSGSPHIGQSVFAWRGCSRCHGAAAEGSVSVPPLRGRGRTYNSISLATALWRHGREMYRSAQEAAQPWPVLQESDIGDLLSFLNSTATNPHPPAAPSL